MRNKRREKRGTESQIGATKRKWTQREYHQTHRQKTFKVSLVAQFRLNEFANDELKGMKE